MRNFKLILASAFVLLAMTLAACTPEQGYNTNTQSTTEVKKEDAKITPEPTKNDDYVKTTEITHEGKKKTILSDYRGHTLYYFTEDTQAEVKCTGACAQAWPPYVYKGEGTIKHTTTISGKLGYVKKEYGQHVTYNGHYLYTFSGDIAPGEYKGEGKEGKWYVAGNDLPGK
jgi:predicted lipoprotein with Yx(FWY)xxD motif